MNFDSVCIKFFGTSSLLGLDMGFWVSMAAVLVIVVLMNLVFWNIKPSGKK